MDAVELLGLLVLALEDVVEVLRLLLLLLALGLLVEVSLVGLELFCVRLCPVIDETLLADGLEDEGEDDSSTAEVEKFVFDPVIDLLVLRPRGDELLAPLGVDELLFSVEVSWVRTNAARSSAPRAFRIYKRRV